MSFVERELERLGLGHQMVSFHGAHTRLSFLYPWSPSPGGGLGGSASSPFFPTSLSLNGLFFLLYQHAAILQRSRVGLTFSGRYLSHQPILKVVGGWL